MTCEHIELKKWSVRVVRQWSKAHQRDELTLRTVGPVSGCVWWGDPSFVAFDELCTEIAKWIRMPLTNYQSVIVQAMLGTNSVKSAAIGPGGNITYQRVEAVDGR